MATGFKKALKLVRALKRLNPASPNSTESLAADCFVRSDVFLVPTLAGQVNSTPRAEAMRPQYHQNDKNNNNINQHLGRYSGDRRSGSNRESGRPTASPKHSRNLILQYFVHFILKYISLPSPLPGRLHLTFSERCILTLIPTNKLQLTKNPGSWGNDIRLKLLLGF